MGTTCCPKSRSSIFPFAYLQQLDQLFHGEDVIAHGRETGSSPRDPGRVCRLFQERGDVQVFVHMQDTESRGLIYGDIERCNGKVRLVHAVIRHHLRDVHLVDMVASEDDRILGAGRLDEAQVLVDGVGRALIPLFAHTGRFGRDRIVKLTKAHPLAPGVLDVFAERVGMILGQDIDLADA